uniref:Coiled-coil domain containing 160 n=1 Tax=Electrophorus electricus TaxID=8005 RepID=A0AAY5E7K0_ELEEL
MTDRTAEPSEELDTSRHWIETLFPPYFTVQDLSTTFMSSNQPCEDTESSRRVCFTALKEVQQREAEMRRNPAKRIIDEQLVDSQRPGADVQHKDSHEIINPDCKGKDSDVDRCIWNKEDISQLRMVLSEIERDRWRLRERLRSSGEQLNSERETMRRLLVLLEDREGQLKQAREEAARHSLAGRALKVEVHSINIQLQELTRQSSQQAEEVRQLRANLREAMEQYHQIKQEAEARAVGVEYEAVVASLQRQVEEAGAALREEKEDHWRSRTALEVLRRHLGKLQRGEVQENPTYIEIVQLKK